MCYSEEIVNKFGKGAIIYMNFEWSSPVKNGRLIAIIDSADGSYIKTKYCLNTIDRLQENTTIGCSKTSYIRLATEEERKELYRYINEYLEEENLNAQRNLKKKEIKNIIATWINDNYPENISLGVEIAMKALEEI